jgi:hypothetical protein
MCEGVSSSTYRRKIARLSTSRPSPVPTLKSAFCRAWYFSAAEVAVAIRAAATEVS